MGSREVTNKPLNMIEVDDPVSCAMYSEENNLLGQTGWIKFQSLANREKKLLRLQNQFKLRSYRTSPKFEFGHEIPRNNDYDRDLSIDNKNGNNKWTECIKLKIDQQHQHYAYKDMDTGQATKNDKNIRSHFVFYAKHDGTHKSSLVANGHLTDVLLSSTYSDLLSIRGKMLVLFLAELSVLES